MAERVSWKNYLTVKRVVVCFVCIFSIITVTAVSVYFGTNNKDKDGEFNQDDRFPHYNVEEDYSDIQFIITKAAQGSFDNTVWSILNKKPYLINVIPENNTYASLHHAVLHNDSLAVYMLTNYSSCDVRVKSAPTEYNKFAGGRIPEQLALDVGIRNYLRNFTEEKLEERFRSTPVFFATQAKGGEYNKYGLPLFLVTLSAFKKTFYGNVSINPNTHFQKTLRYIFKSPNQNLENVQNEVINSLFGFDLGSANNLRSQSTEEFYGKLIRLYTGLIFSDVNLVLRREALFDYKTYRPRSIGLHLGPYAIMLDSVLTFWDELIPYSNVTYRGVNFNVTSHYQLNMTFVFLEFLSSSDRQSVAEAFAGTFGSIFVINNSQTTPWQPRNIVKFSSFPRENEILYPPGAEFSVTGNDGRYIYLDLMNPAYV